MQELGHALSEASKGDAILCNFLASGVAGNLGCSLACGCITPFSAAIFHGISLCLLLFSKNTTLIKLGFTLTEYDLTLT